jgi:phosphomannomutase/phosphoglucomutase
MKLKINLGSLNTSLKQQFILLAGTALAVLAIVGGGLYYSAARSLRQEAATASRLVAQTAASDLARMLALAQGTLERQAQDPEYARILGGGDPSRILAAEERLTRAVPGALLVRLLPDSVETLDEQRAPRMGYADLDAVRQARDGQPQPAMHAANTPDAHIALVKRLAEGNGVLLASLAPALATGLAPPERGALELKQQALSLAFQGDPALKQAEPDGAAPVPGTPWTVAYWGQPSGAVGSPWFLALLGLAVALGGGGIYLGYRWCAGALRHDQDNLALMVRDLLSAKAYRKYPLRLKEMRRLEIHLEQLKSLPVQAPSPEKPAAQPKPAGRETTAPPKPPVGPAAYAATTVPEPALALESVDLSPAIFRTYDIRGVVGDTLSAEVLHLLGRAIGSEARERGEYTVAVARDGRVSSAELSRGLAQGLLRSGCSVIDLGLVPTPVLYFATHVLNTESGVMVTGSHDPADRNGLKIVIAGEVLAGPDLQKLRQRIEQGNFSSGTGQMETRDLAPDYLERIAHDAQLGRSMKIVVDCGNGATGEIAPKLLEEIGCEVLPLFTQIDGSFPNHPPDPSRPDNLATLIRAVRQEGADLGVAFDGDGDRLGVVDSSGRIIGPDRQMMLLAADVLSREPGSDIVFDVQCTRHLAGHIVRNGGRPLMWKSGRSPMRAKLKETGALLAGEMDGHILFKERWYGFEDGLYACARLAEVLSADPRSTAEVFAELPEAVATPELRIPMPEGKNALFIERLREIADFPDARVSDIDGLRVDFADGWGLARASTASPSLALRFEADTPDALARIQKQFKNLMQQVDPGISFPLSIS